MKIFLCFSLCVLMLCQSFANVSLPKIFGDNMVLQRDKKIPVWGWATANEKVTVQFNQQTKTVTADSKGNWMVKLDNEAAGGPYQLVVKGTNTITFSNVLVGEVWVCSGQSNMEMPIEGWGKVNNYEQEIKDANYPQIRHIKVPNTISTKPEKDIKSGEWKICSPQTAGDFTAAGYFFARELYNQLHIPIGLINTSWGGTQVESWISRSAFEQTDEFKEMIAGMPQLDFDSLNQVRKAAMMNRVSGLQGNMNVSDTANWMKLDYNDAQWPKMQLPGYWETKQLSDVDGVVWYRKTINVPQQDAGKTATITLGSIDDNDVTYINGVQVGATNLYIANRNYQVPAGVLKAGANVIAIRIEDTGGNGGVNGDNSDLKLTVGSDELPLSGEWMFRVQSVRINSFVGPNSYPTILFNAMINPLIPYAIEGAIWYQGESNAGRAYQYRKAFPLMITDWRKRWNEGDFPFYFVQLASFGAGNGNSEKGSTWAELREAQTMTLSLPNTGMAVTTDIGDKGDIHPKNKQDVGKRLADIALHDVYKKDMVYTGPMYQSMQANGNKVALTFKSIGSGLMMKGDKLSGFEVAGDDQKFHDATATIDGDKIVVSSDSVSTPVAVRYGWKDFAGDDNLFNKEGFPASPFRTDKWKGVTEADKYDIGR